MYSYINNATLTEADLTMLTAITAVRYGIATRSSFPLNRTELVVLVFMILDHRRCPMQCIRGSRK